MVMGAPKYTWDGVSAESDEYKREQRELLVMRYYKNMSFKEIADHTKVSINTALGRMRYAILNLRKMAEENNIVLTL